MQKRLAPHLALEQLFALRVDRVHLELLRIGNELREEAPEHHLQRAHPFTLIPDNNRLHRLRSSVVIRSEFQRETIHIAKLEGFSDALLIRASLVASAHEGSRLSRQDKASRQVTHIR